MFRSLDHLAKHEKFVHSRHPLNGDYGDWLERVERLSDSGRDEDSVKIKEVGVAAKDEIHGKMTRMGSEFFLMKRGCKE